VVTGSYVCHDGYLTDQVPLPWGHTGQDRGSLTTACLVTVTQVLEELLAQAWVCHWCIVPSMMTPVLYPGDRVHLAIFAKTQVQVDGFLRTLTKEYQGHGVEVVAWDLIVTASPEPTRVLAVFRAAP